MLKFAHPKDIVTVLVAVYAILATTQRTVPSMNALASALEVLPFAQDSVLAYLQIFVLANRIMLVFLAINRFAMEETAPMLLFVVVTALVSHLKFALAMRIGQALIVKYLFVSQSIPLFPRYVII